MAYHTRNNNSSNNRSLNKESKKSSLKKIASKFPKLSINNNRNEGRVSLTPSIREFGRAEDYIELNIYDNNESLISHTRNFTDFSFSSEGINPQTGLSDEIIIDPNQTLSKLKFKAGGYKLEYRFQRKKFFNSFERIFFIKEISNSRNEIRVASNKISNTQLEQRYKSFEQEIQDSTFLKDFTLNFGQGVNVIAINIALDKTGDNYSILIKLFEPLPSKISINDIFRITEDLTEPAVFDTTVDAPPINDGTIIISGPNYKVNTRLNSSVPSEFKTYDELLNGGISSSYQNLVNALSSSFEPSIEYDNLNTDSGYHFENFTHFSSATERLNNFKYKLKLIELYDSQVSNINTITGDASSSITVLNNKKNIEIKKNKVIGGFDGYERFLYFESGTYSWPKSNSIKPYIQSPITSSEALNWLGSNIGNSSYYGGQLFSSSKFDDQNIYNLNKVIPEYIKNNPDNKFYQLFADMIGQHFDQSWLYIKSLTENKKAENHLNRGIDKDLVYTTLKSLGIKVFDEFENVNLFEYMTGINKEGSLFHTTSSNETLISSSNVGSLPKVDITKEKWKRIYHNLPYLLKTKGTERGIRALITSYGIPSTVLNIKEFGGSTTDSTKYKTFSYDKQSYALTGDSGNGNFFVKTAWSSSLTDALSSSAKTVEFRIKPHRSDSNYHLWSLTDSPRKSLSSLSNIPEDTFFQSLILEPYIGNDISSSGDSTQYGRLKWSINNSSSRPELATWDGSTISDWGLAYGNTTLSANSNNLRAKANAAGAYGTSQALTTEVGEVYKVEATINVDNASGETGNLRIANDLALSINPVTLSTSTGKVITVFKASTTTTYIGLVDTADDSSNFLELENISVTELGNVTTTDYFPIYNGDFWNIFIGIDAKGIDPNPTTSSFALLEFGAYQANHLKNINYYRASHSLVQHKLTHANWGLDTEGATVALRAGASFCYIGGMESTTLDNNIDEINYSGSLQEVKYHFGELLSHDTLVKHALEPSMYSGNTISSSYNNLVLRLPLGGNSHKTITQSFHPKSDIDYLTLLNREFSYNLFNYNELNSLGTGVSLVSSSAIHFDQVSQYVKAQNQNFNVDLEENDIVELRFSVRNYSGSGNASLAIYNDEGKGAKITANDNGTFSDIVRIGSISHGSITTAMFIENTVTDKLTATIDDISILKLPQTNLTNETNLKWENITETHHLPTPDTVGKSMTSEKVRIDDGEVEDNILSYDIKTETSTLDRQPLDTNDLGVYFSPSFEMNKDIIYQLGSFRLDDYIGDPTHISENSYPDLKTLSNEYFKKNVNRYDYTDFLHSVKQFDHTLFKMIENMVPAKSNLKTGVVIEPHYLERTKIGHPSSLPTITQHNNYKIDYDLDPNSENSTTGLNSQYLLTDVSYNLDENNFTFDVTSEPLLNNITSGRTSKKYFTIIKSTTEEWL